MSISEAKRSTLILLGGILIAQLFYPVVCHFVFYYLDDTVLAMGLHYLVICLAVLVLYFYSVKAETNGFLILPEKRYKVLFYILSIVVLYLLQLPGHLMAKIPKLLGWHEIWERNFGTHFWYLASGWYHLNIAILFLCTTTWSITTELIFRGYLIPRLNILFKNKAVAIICSSILYSVFPFGTNSLKWLISDFFSGIFFGWHYQKYHNIKVLIATRVLIDLIYLYFLREDFLRLHI